MSSGINPEDLKGLGLTPGDVLSIEEWGRIEGVGFELMLKQVLDRGLATVTEELNRKWINRRLTANLLDKENIETE